jgi:hypothetical protein
MTNMQIIVSLKSFTEFINKVYGTHIRETLGGYYNLLFAGVVTIVTMQPKGSATGHVDTDFLDFPLTSSFSCSPPDFNSSKLSLCCGGH